MVTYSQDRNKIEHESSAALQGCTDIKSGKGHLMHTKNSPRAVIIPIGPSIAYVPLTKGQFSLIDADDAHLIGRWNWRAQWKANAKVFYASRKSGKSEGRRCNILMHRQIMGDPEGFQVDHIHGDTLDNRRSELRIATGSQNQWNTKMRSDNASGFKGVSWHTATGRWQAKISAHKKRMHLGYFDTAQEAHEAYCVAAREYHGEFRRVA